MAERGKLSVFVFGAGKVGRALTSALRRARWTVTLRAARKGLPRKPIDADIVVLALRDRELAETVKRLRETNGLVETLRWSSIARARSGPTCSLRFVTCARVSRRCTR